MAIFLMFVSWKNKKIIFYKNKSVLVASLIILGALLSCFAGVTHGDSVYGLLRVGSAAVWVVLLMQFGKAKREKLLGIFPVIAVVIIAISALLSNISIFSKYVMENKFLAGPFGYANVMGLFLLLAFITSLYNTWEPKWMTTWLSIVIRIVLLVGVLWTGSRITIGITVAVLIFTMVKRKDLWEKSCFYLFITVDIVAVYLILMLIRKGQSVLESALNMSGMMGRFLYWKDALPLILKHPLGLGYQGYHLLSESNKTGVYTVWYVHNDWLQIALDYGWIAIIGFVALIIFQWKRMDALRKLLLVVMGIHMFMDMDLEFLAITWILMLFMDFQYGKEKSLNIEKKRVCVIIPAIVLCAVFIWTGLAEGTSSFGKYALSNKIYPWRTETKKNLILQSLNHRDALSTEVYCYQLLKMTTVDAVGYDAMARVLQAKGDYMGMVQMKREAVWRQPYWTADYDDYIRMIGIALEEFDAIGMGPGTESYELCRGMLMEVPQRLEYVEAHTSPLAYKLNVTPYFELNDVSQVILEEYVPELYFDVEDDANSVMDQQETDVVNGN